ncbi:MAG TPA: hypothetical protein VMN36_08340 [Verrucomicrobiales bacterium]|nr:hypothetical protein [Verrucomicrobiales bacterium]
MLGERAGLWAGLQMLDHAGTVVSTVNVQAPTGGGPMDDTVEIPVPWGK